MIRRMLCLLLILCLTPLCVPAEQAERTVIYRVELKSPTTLHAAPDRNSQRIMKIPRHVSIDVYEYGEEWCLCGYEGQTGYMLTVQLYEFWRMADRPVPCFQQTVGVARMTASAHVSNKEYPKGTQLEPGDVVAVLDENGLIPMYRSTSNLPEGSFEFTPFVPAEESVPGDLLSGFSTWYDGTPSHGLYINRAYNIALGCSRVNGVTVMPGQQYSMNGAIGPYLQANGYLKGPTTGDVTAGFGGGTCQVTTTLYDAVLSLYGLRIDVWQVHSRDGARYVPLNMDACVSNTLDMCFTNTYDFPVTLCMDCRGGVMTALIYHGTAEEIPLLSF